MGLFAKRRPRPARQYSDPQRGGGGSGRSSDSLAFAQIVEMAPPTRLPQYNGYQYSTVPSMEMSPLLNLPPPSKEGSHTDSSAGSDRGTDRRRDDRRRGRLNTELLTAVLVADVVEVNRRLKEGASVNATCRPTRTTALQLAVACGDEVLAHLLLAQGADPSMRDRAGRQAVHLAAATGNLPLLRLLLDSAPSAVDSQVTPFTPDLLDNDYLDSWSHDHDAVADKIPLLSKGATPLHLATQRLHLECVAELLRRGSKVSLADERGLTPLDVVAETPAAASSGILVGPDAFPTTDETLTRIENMRERISRLPSARPRQMRIQIPDGPRTQQARHILPGEPGPPSPPVLLPSAFRSSDPTIVITPTSPSKSAPSLAQQVVNELMNRGATMPRSKVIVKQGAVQNQVTMSMTCLHTAVEREDLPLIEYLLERGACQLTWNSEGLTPLHLAVTKRLLEPLKVLLERKQPGQVVDARDMFGRTPLHLSVAEEWFLGVSLLLEAGADVKITSNDNQTVLHVAARKSDPQLLEELLTIPESVKIIDSCNNVHETPLWCAVNSGQLGCVSLLLARGADITTSKPGDVTLLHLAAERGDRPCLEALLRDRRMADFKNVRCKENKGGTTALHLAAMGGSLDCVELLVTSGCDVQAVTTTCPHFGSTALHLAAVRGHCKVVECIVKHNRNTLCAMNVDGWYPLHVAARFNKRDCVKYMLLNGANLAATVMDSEGYKKTALDIIVYSIVHPETFLEKILDDCLKVNDYPLNHPKCTIRVDYGLLQPLGPQRKQLKVLDSFLNCGKSVVRERILLHPLVETFLHLKWKRLRLFFFLMMALYLVFTVSLTTMAMFYYVLMTQSEVVDLCISTCRVTLCVSLTIILLQELLQATRMQRYYVKDLESWVKWCTFVLSSVVVLGHHPAPWLVHVSAVAVLLSWLELLFLLSRWPSALGFYILMFFTVAKNVLRVLATFTFVILGFTFAFMIHFQAQVPFDNWWEALVKVMVMALEFDYGALYEGIKGVDATSIVGRGIFLSFMILVAIVLMNLLVGLAVSDIATLEKQGRAQRLAKQIDFLSLLEMFVYNRNLFFCCPKKIADSVRGCRAAESELTVEPGKPLRKTRSVLPFQMRQSIINNIVEKFKNGNKDECECEEDDCKSTDTDLEHPKGEEKQDKETSDKEENPTHEAEVNNSLKTILNELATLKQDIEMIKMKIERPPSVRRPSSEVNSTQLIFA